MNQNEYRLRLAELELEHKRRLAQLETYAKIGSTLGETIANIVGKGIEQSRIENFQRQQLELQRWNQWSDNYYRQLDYQLQAAQYQRDLTTDVKSRYYMGRYSAYFFTYANGLSTGDTYTTFMNWDKYFQEMSNDQSYTEATQYVKELGNLRYWVESMAANTYVSPTVNVPTLYNAIMSGDQAYFPDFAHFYVGLTERQKQNVEQLVKKYNAGFWSDFVRYYDGVVKELIDNVPGARIPADYAPKMLSDAQEGMGLVVAAYAGAAEEAKKDKTKIRQVHYMPVAPGLPTIAYYLAQLTDLRRFDGGEDIKNLFEKSGKSLLAVGLPLDLYRTNIVRPPNMETQLLPALIFPDEQGSAPRLDALQGQRLIEAAVKQNKLPGNLNVDLTTESGWRELITTWVASGRAKLYAHGETRLIDPNIAYSGVKSQGPRGTGVVPWDEAWKTYAPFFIEQLGPAKLIGMAMYEAAINNKYEVVSPNGDAIIKVLPINEQVMRMSATKIANEAVPLNEVLGYLMNKSHGEKKDGTAVMAWQVLERAYRLGLQNRLGFSLGPYAEEIIQYPHYRWNQVLSMEYTGRTIPVTRTSPQTSVQGPPSLSTGWRGQPRVSVPKLDKVTAAEVSQHFRTIRQATTDPEKMTPGQRFRHLISGILAIQRLQNIIDNHYQIQQRENPYADRFEMAIGKTSALLKRVEGKGVVDQEYLEQYNMLTELYKDLLRELGPLVRSMWPTELGTGQVGGDEDLMVQLGLFPSPQVAPSRGGVPTEAPPVLSPLYGKEERAPLNRIPAQPPSGQGAGDWPKLRSF